MPRAKHDGFVNTTVAALFQIAVLITALAFWGYCLVDFVQSDERLIRTFPKQVWLVLLVLGSVVGGVLWLIYGRPEDRPR